LAVSCCHKELSAFRVLFIGRIEFDKGVFDLLEAARKISKQGIKDIVFDICGDGTALDSLRQTVTQDSWLCLSYSTPKGDRTTCR
jgi:glycogen synthase